MVRGVRLSLKWPFSLGTELTTRPWFILAPQTGWQVTSVGDGAGSPIEGGIHGQVPQDCGVSDLPAGLRCQDEVRGGCWL